MEGDMYRERYRDNMGERARDIWVELGVQRLIEGDKESQIQRELESDG